MTAAAEPNGLPTKRHHNPRLLHGGSESGVGRRKQDVPSAFTLWCLVAAQTVGTAVHRWEG